MSRSAGIWFALVAVLPLASCVPAAAGYDDVQATTADRLGQKARWREHDGAAVDRETQQLLAKPLDPAAAVQIALLNNASVQASYEKLGIARAERVRALRLPNPSVGAALRYGNGDRPEIDLDATLSVSHLLFMSGRDGAATAGLDAAKLEVAGDIVELAFATRIAFFDYQAAMQQASLRHSVLQSLRGALDMTERLHEAGNVTDLNLASQRALYEEARIGLARDEAQAAAARETLNQRMGVWGAAGAQWTAARSLPEAMPLGAVFTDLEQRAVQQSLELGAARKRFEAAARHANVATWEGWIPDVRFGVNAERGDADWGIGPMAEIELPIFYQGQAEAAGAEAQMRRERQLLVDAAVRIRSSARSLVASLQTAAASVSHYRNVVLPLRAQVVEQTQLQYNAMNVGLFELLQAKRDELAAQQQYVSALHDYWVMRSQIEQLLAGSAPNVSSAGLATVAAEPVSSSTRGH